MTPARGIRATHGTFLVLPVLLNISLAAWQDWVVSLYYPSRTGVVTCDLASL